MLPVQLSRVPGAIAVIALAAAAAGCSGGTTAAQPAAKTGHAAAASAASAGSAYTAAQLRSALLTSVNGVRPAVPAEAGAYGSLPGVTATKRSLAGVKITPAKCARVSATGLSSGKFNAFPATVVTFRFAAVGASEVLLAPPSAMLTTALAQRIPGGCSRYRARIGGKTYTYRVTQERAPRIGDASSEVNVRATGPSTANIWTIIYRSHGLVGAVTLIGPHASKAAAEALTKLAYARAMAHLASA
jgi:hypothetical protein